MDFQIGEKIKWTVGRIKSTGVFLEDNLDGTADVITHTINNRISNNQITVKKDLLKLDI